MGMELEWKFSADEAALARVQSEIAADWRTIEMESRYYDTPTRALSARRWTLRLRQENGKAVVCLKTPRKGRGRGEWEVSCGNISEAIGPLLDQGAPEELPELLAEQALEQVCTAHFTRRAALLERDGTSFELALDLGELTGGGKSLPLCEVEVEHKSGESGVSEAFASSLAARFRLREEERSKFQRALSLTKTSPGVVPGAPSI